MLKVIFLVATLTPNGPAQGEVNDKARFGTEAECHTFGDHMAPRVADWVRGSLNADWDHPVAVQHKCETDGNPA